jgi:hypothetical protein
VTPTDGDDAPPGALRPAAVCRELLRALEASDGRRQRRKRDTTPDSLGMALKRELLEAVVQADPDPAAFEPWLLERCWQMAGAVSVGAARAMALEIASEWHLAAESPAFRDWLAHGAPSDDARGGDAGGGPGDRRARPARQGDAR